MHLSGGTRTKGDDEAVDALHVVDGVFELELSVKRGLDDHGRGLQVLALDVQTQPLVPREGGYRSTGRPWGYHKGAVVVRRMGGHSEVKGFRWHGATLSTVTALGADVLTAAVVCWAGWSVGQVTEDESAAARNG